MDVALRATAQQIRAAMPCSIEMPAGSGKTHLVAAVAAAAVEAGERPLILTHTNAGVDALRRRLRAFGVAPSAVGLDTIASWSFALARHYPVLAGVTLKNVPDWSQSDQYYRGAAATAGAGAIRRVLRASYDFVVVDEYQDCVVQQNELVMMLHAVLPVCVLGDPLQNIFNFGQNQTVKWSTHVLPEWPALSLPTEPWRWKGHNEALGQWLVEIRDNLRAGRPIDLAKAPLTWVRDNHATAGSRACLDWAGKDGSVVAIGPWPPVCASIASRTNGAFTMMEELEGKFMLKFADRVDSGKPEVLAYATVQFARGCIAGVAAKLDNNVARKLEAGKPVDHLKREGAEEQLKLLSRLLTEPTPALVRTTLLSIGRLQGARLYRREAWRDMLQALAMVAAGSEISVREALMRTRNRTRIIGRVPERRVISRPLLIKGLEYDYAVVLGANQYKATELYVALTRARKGLAVVSKSRYLNPDVPVI
jgi:hypothetical protein